MGSIEGSKTIRLRKQTLPPIKTNGVAITHAATDENEPLSPMARLFHKPECNLHIIAIIGSKTRINVEHVKSVLPDTLLKHPRFCSSQVKDEKDVMRWVGAKVNLDDHVHAPKLNKDNSALSSDQLVEDYICNLTNIPLDQDKPLWDIHILNDITTTKEGANAVAVLRFHHSLGDGTSLMSLLLSFTRKASDPNSIPTIPFPIKKTSLMNDQLSKGIWSLTRLVWNTIVDVIMFLATAWFLSDDKNPLKADKKVAMNPKRVVYRSVSMDDIKYVKNATGTTINDVVMGVAEAGLSRYLNRRYGEGKETKENDNNLPKDIRFRSVLFFNIRLFSGIHPVEDMMEKGSLARWGNQIGYVLYPFNIVKRDNPVNYVHQAKATMDRKKSSLESRFAYLISKFFLKHFGLQAASLPSNPTMWFSNMVGPREEMTLFGYPVAFIAPTCYGQPTGLMIHVMTYMDKLSFILSVDDETVPDPHRLCDDLEESLRLIKDAVMPG
ncbi:hypothetical protein QQ045_010725 [Rhodiola kirilowii]